MSTLITTHEVPDDPPTLASRLQAEILAAGGCGFGPPMIGAWTVLPGGGRES